MIAIAFWENSVMRKQDQQEFLLIDQESTCLKVGSEQLGWEGWS